jgi:hypothetical protein
MHDLPVAFCSLFSYQEARIGYKTEFIFDMSRYAACLEATVVHAGN